MPITLVKKTMQIFTGLSTVSTVSLVPSFMRKVETTKLPSGGRQISNEHREEPKVETQTNTENILQRAVKMMELKEGNQEGEKKCFWLFEDKNWFELLMCVNMKTLSPITLFHYTWRDKGLNEVTEMTYNGTSILKMTYDSRGTKDVPNHLRTSFAWYRGREKSFIPKTDCKMEQIEETTKEYTLTCKDPNNEGGNGLIRKVIPELPNESKKI